MMKTVFLLGVVFLHFLFPSLANTEIFYNINDFKYRNKLSDTNGFDKAVEFVAKTGGTLYVPKGIYYLDNAERTRKGIHGNSYMFLVSNDFKIIFEEGARLHFRNGFKGFRFRSTPDPSAKTVNRFNVEIRGGIINAKYNFVKKVMNNPNNWGIVGETLKSFTVTNMKIEDLSGSAGIASYSNDYCNISGNMFNNVTGNPFDRIDNHGDAIYVANTYRYVIGHNTILNEISADNRMGRIGICIEYQQSRNGEIYNNTVSGYDRGIHVELISGTAKIRGNILSGNTSGIVLWNNNGHKQIIEKNSITNRQLARDTKPILYTSSPILLLGHNSNSGTIIVDNTVTIYNEYYIPKSLLAITSSNMTIANNRFIDKSRTLPLSISEGRSRSETISNILFERNIVEGGKVFAFDGEQLVITDNNFNVNQIVFSFLKTKNIVRNNIYPKTLSTNQVKFFGDFSN